MMLQKPSSRWAGAKVLLFVPLVGLAMGAFAHTAYVVPNDKVTKEKPKVSAPAPKSSSATTQLKTNTLDEKGKKTMEVIAPADIESISVQKDTLNPKRNVMKVTIKNTPATTDQESRKSIVFSGDLSKAKLLYYIDGKEASQEEMKALSPNQIASIAIDKSDASVKERGYDASVHITTRPEEESSASRTVVIKDNSSVSLMTSNGANESTIEVQNDGSSHNMRLTSSGMNEKALVVIDGKRASRKDLLQYNPEQIESITVLKGKQATDLYGKRGENGVIIVTTKR